MALTNSLKQSPQPLNYWTPQSFTIPSTFPGALSAYSGGYTLATGAFPSKKYRVELADLVGLGAYITGDIILESLPAGACPIRTLVKANTAVTGVTTCVGYVKTAGQNYGTTTFDLKAAVSATNFDLDVAHAKIESMAAATNLLFHVITTVDNLSAATAGQIDIWVDYLVFSV